jgi:hypothetical protein
MWVGLVYGKSQNKYIYAILAIGSKPIPPFALKSGIFGGYSVEHNE